jgi:hypothetical protein
MSRARPDYRRIEVTCDPLGAYDDLLRLLRRAMADSTEVKVKVGTTYYLVRLTRVEERYPPGRT